MATKGDLVTQEWTCPRHGAVLAPAGAKKAGRVRCKWCGNVLTLNTWKMNG